MASLSLYCGGWGNLNSGLGYAGPCSRPFFLAGPVADLTRCVLGCLIQMSWLVCTIHVQLSTADDIAVQHGLYNL